MNQLQLESSRDAIQNHINLVVQDQGNHTELSYALRWLTVERIITLMARISEIESNGGQVTYELLATAIGEEEMI